MKLLRSHIALFICLCGVGLPVQTSFAQRAEAPSKLAAFELKDQFGGRVSRDDFKDSIVIVIGGNRSASAASEHIGMEIKRSFLDNESLKDHLVVSQKGQSFAIRSTVGKAKSLQKTPIRIIPVADVAGVPSPLRWLVRQSMSSENDSPVLLDWEGHFTTDLGFEKDEVNILLFSPGGNLRFQHSGRTIQLDQLKQIAAITESLIGSMAFQNNTSGYER